MEAADPIRGSRQTREHDDAHIRMLSEVASDLETTLIGQQYVQHDNVWRAHYEQPVELRCAPNTGDFVSRGDKGGSEDYVTQFSIVLHKYNVQRSGAGRWVD